MCAVCGQELNDTCAGLRMLGNRRDTTVVDQCEVNSECTTLNCTTPAWPPQLLSITVDPCAGEVTYEHNTSVTISASKVVCFQIGGEVDEANFTLVVNDTGMEFGVSCMCVCVCGAWWWSGLGLGLMIHGSCVRVPPLTDEH